MQETIAASLREAVDRGTICPFSPTGSTASSNAARSLAVDYLHMRGSQARPAVKHVKRTF